MTNEAVCVDCGEEEEKDHWLECPAKERSRRICGITEVGYLCDEPALVGYRELASLTGATTTISQQHHPVFVTDDLLG